MQALELVATAKLSVVIKAVSLLMVPLLVMIPISKRLCAQTIGGLDLGPVQVRVEATSVDPEKVNDTLLTNFKIVNRDQVATDLTIVSLDFTSEGSNKQPYAEFVDSKKQLKWIDAKTVVVHLDPKIEAGFG